MTESVFIPPGFPLMYRAVGQVHGRFIPSEKKITKGVLLTDDGMLIPARLVAKAAWMVKVNPDIIKNEIIWSAYPYTDFPVWFERMRAFLPDEEAIAPAKTEGIPAFWFQLRDVREPRKNQTLEELRQGNNYFSIRGQIFKQDVQEGKLIVRICRNKIPPGKEQDPEYQPIDLTIDGFLPGKVEGQFWDLDVSREGNLLLVENGSFVADLSPPEAETSPAEPQNKQAKQKSEGKETHKTETITKTQPKLAGKIIRLVK